MRVRLAASAGSIFGMAASAAVGSSTRLKYCSRTALLERLQRQALVLGAHLAQRVERALVGARPAHADVEQGPDRRLARAALGDAGLQLGDALLDQGDALRRHARAAAAAPRRSTPMPTIACSTGES